MRLLLVEGSSSLRRSLALGLRKAGYTVDDTGDGQEGQWESRNREVRLDHPRHHAPYCERIRNPDRITS